MKPKLFTPARAASVRAGLAVAVFATLSATLLAPQAVRAQSATQKAAANYRGPSPADQALVKRAEAARWRDSNKRSIEARTTGSSLGSSNLTGQKDCTTQIGAPPQQDTGFNRYGPNGNQRDVVVVTGSVINICK